MVSDKQAAANRRNASKSTGPKTDTGKNTARKQQFRSGSAGKGQELASTQVKS